MKTHIASIVALLCAPSALAINYIDLERMAADTACKITPNECTPFVEASREAGNLDVYKVDGRVMPPDAIVDDKQQKQMLPANLYVKKDGSVAQLYEVDIELLKSKAVEKNTVLPFKNFDIPPAISGATKKLIITTGEE